MNIQVTKITPSSAGIMNTVADTTVDTNIVNKESDVVALPPVKNNSEIANCDADEQNFEDETNFEDEPNLEEEVDEPPPPKKPVTNKLFGAIKPKQNDSSSAGTKLLVGAMIVGMLSKIF